MRDSKVQSCRAIPDALRAGLGLAHGRLFVAFLFGLGIVVAPAESRARPTIRSSFFAVYPSAVGSAIETVTSHANHCGQCHFDFSGGGPRNAYGVRLGEVIDNYANNDAGRQQAIRFIENEDPDADGYSSRIEITDVTTFSNTPTFAGLTPVNAGNVLNVNVAEIQGHLVPSTGGDTTPPSVSLVSPNGGQTYTANAPATVQWTASDASGIAAIDVYLSLDNGATYRPVAVGLSNTGSHTWFPANRPTATARILVWAIDHAFNEASDASNNVFTIQSPPGGIAPTTLRDFDMPGTQPFGAGAVNDPSGCAVCHGNYNTSAEPFFNWQGSMMAQASIDILFEACMAVANQDAPDSGDLCLRCHISKGWLGGRSIPTNGNQMLTNDKVGLACDFCHRLVDPFYDPAANPSEDADILADLELAPTNFANGMYVVDPDGTRRGPFVNATSGHAVLVSPFHREAAFCGTCHDVSNPAFEKNAQGNYVPNAFDQPATNFSSHTLAPIERTYSEWFYSAYNSPSGIFAPQFGGNKSYVATCQDCHLRDVTGQGCNTGTAPTRSDLPLHDMTGGSTWLPGLLSSQYPGQVNDTALQAGIARARYMLQNAADLAVAQNGMSLDVRVTNNGGHKLPTGYPEGRRAWINVKFFDDAMTLLSESAAYNPATGALSHDAQAKIYEAEPGLDSVTAPLVGVPEGPSFHFVLNNKIFKDNRIPPRGFTNASFAQFGGAPVGATYADGQYWDDTGYDIPVGAALVQVTLYYQSTSKEFIEFLRDENTTNDRGQVLYDLWNNNQKCPPEIMRTTTIVLAQCFSNADCDDGVFCNGAEVCEPATDRCVSGAPPCGEDCERCDEAARACAWCPLDLDYNAVMGTGDFAMFASCFGGCYLPADECYEANFDGSADGCVGTSDYAMFANCFGGTCASCAACSGPQ